MGAALRRHRVGQQRLLDREEGAHVASRGVERADRCDHHEDRERRGQAEGHARRDHEQRNDLEEATAVDVATSEAEEEGDDRRSEERRGDDRANFGGTQTTGDEVGGQDGGDRSVDQRTYASGGEQPTAVARQ